VGLKLNGTRQAMVCADNIHLLGDNINTVKKITEAVINASNEIGLEVIAEYVAVL
jgi:hypothetical protein